MSLGQVPGFKRVIDIMERLKPLMAK
jgi:hypothetical protein